MPGPALLSTKGTQGLPWGTGDDKWQQPAWEGPGGECPALPTAGTSSPATAGDCPTLPPCPRAWQNLLPNGTTPCMDRLKKPGTSTNFITIIPILTQPWVTIASFPIVNYHLQKPFWAERFWAFVLQSAIQFPHFKVSQSGTDQCSVPHSNRGDSRNHRFLTLILQPSHIFGQPNLQSLPLLLQTLASVISKEGFIFEHGLIWGLF